jgi:hypothetical protein
LISKTWASQQVYGEAQQAIAAAVRIFGGQPSDTAGYENWHEWLETMLVYADQLYFRGETAELQAICSQVGDVINVHGSQTQQADFYTTLGMLNNRLFRYAASAETLRYVRQALDIALALGDPVLISRKRFGLGFNLLISRDPFAAVVELQQALEQAVLQGNTYLQDQSLAYISVVNRMIGNRSAVRDYSQRGLDLAMTENHPTYIGVARANLAWAALMEGRIEEAWLEAQAAMTTWGAGLYVMEWLAGYVLAQIAFDRSEFALAAKYLAAPLDSRQQRPPVELEPILESIRNAPEAELPDLCRKALTVARKVGYL